MTSEHLSSRIRADDEIEALCSFLGQFFDEVHAVAYLRRPDHLAPSLFAEGVKAGRTKPLNAGFVKQHDRSFDHAGFLAQWSAILGSTNVVQAVRRVVQGSTHGPGSRPAQRRHREQRASRLGEDTGLDLARPAAQPVPQRRGHRVPPVGEPACAGGRAHPVTAPGADRRGAQRCPGAAVTLTTGARPALIAAGLLDRWSRPGGVGRDGSAVGGVVRRPRCDGRRHEGATAASSGRPDGRAVSPSRAYPLGRSPAAGWVPDGAVDAAADRCRTACSAAL